MPDDSSPRQTASFLKERFAQVGIRPKTRYGQNFLIDLNLLQLLFETAQVDEHDVVLEVGGGTGSLTVLLARAAAAVVTVEVDPQLFQLASEELADFDNVTMLRQDALKNKNRLQPAVLDTVASRLAEGPDRRFKLVANLPYNIATPIISNLLACPLVPATMTITIQKELADRIVARPCTKDYSALSIWIQSQCHVELVRVLPPQVFWPRPKVHSAIVHITFDPALRARIGDLDFFHEFVRALFFHRRKFLRSVVHSAMKERLARETVDSVLERLGFGPTSRAEELDVPTIIRLSDALHAEIQSASS